jgi:glucose/arabinose dehydrogenase
MIVRALDVRYAALASIVASSGAIWLAATACQGDRGPRIESVEDGVRLTSAFPNLTFDRPVDLQHAPDGSSQLYVLEQAGVIRVFENTPEVSATETFLDIRGKVSRNGNEEGLLGLAFHPAFEQNGSFFVYYSAEGPRRGVLARYEVEPAAPTRARADSEAVILEVAQPYGNHNGGQVAFGPDGTLYLGLGDGGSGGDPHGNGQDRSTLLASILRLDVDRPSDGRPYGIPADNPFAGNDAGYREEIFAYGLRNPWRFSWDPRTGQLWTGDVGQNAREEIDVIESGKNYGWNVMEGSRCYQSSGDCSQTGLEPPVLDYPRDEGISITGGFVYRGSAVPSLAGRYVYADYGSGTVWALSFDGKTARENRVVARTSLAISSFWVDAAGELYACAFDGKIYQFVP